jgi:hypothetical protein
MQSRRAREGHQGFAIFAASREMLPRHGVSHRCSFTDPRPGCATARCGWLACRGVRNGKTITAGSSAKNERHTVVALSAGLRETPPRHRVRPTLLSHDRESRHAAKRPRRLARRPVRKVKMITTPLRSPRLGVRCPAPRGVRCLRAMAYG